MAEHLTLKGIRATKALPSGPVKQKGYCGRLNINDSYGRNMRQNTVLCTKSSRNIRMLMMRVVRST